MSYVILVRNPETGKVFPIYDGDAHRQDLCKLYPTEAAAERDAEHHMVCQAWPYSIVEAP